MATLFISDIHLSFSRPFIVDSFLSFLAGPARKAESLYILGDCFDLYLGDDDKTHPHPLVVNALRTLTQTTPVFFQRGNHDFLTSDHFSHTSGCEILEDFSVIKINGKSVLLTHGDLLCTDDTEYQTFRKHTRRPEIQAEFLALSLEQRRIKANHIRQTSKEKSQLKTSEIMDINQKTVSDIMQKHETQILIHGHTHRPDIHHFMVSSKPAVRIVLGDWYEQDSILSWDGDAYSHVRIHDLD